MLVLSVIKRDDPWRDREMTASKCFCLSGGLIIVYFDRTDSSVQRGTTELHLSVHLYWCSVCTGGVVCCSKEPKRLSELNLAGVRGPGSTSYVRSDVFFT